MDEKKVYDFKGSVTISTEEYRDLISENARLEAEASKKNSDYWDEYRRANKAEEALAIAKNELKTLKAFVYSSEEMELKLKLFKVEQMEKDAEVADDGV